SFNIPNGGWDNLWYKTSDGNFVADVDIETGTLNDVAQDCGAGGPAPEPAAAPAPSGDRAAQAVAWARNAIATEPGSRMSCVDFVQQAYHSHFNGLTAMDIYNNLRNQMQHNPDGIPAGALVFTSDPTFDQGMGHVMLSEG